MILLLIVFCPIIAAIAVLAGAPARLTSLCRGRRYACRRRVLPYWLRPHSAGLQLRHLRSDQPGVALNFTLGLDGLSLIMVLLTAIVLLAAVWFTGKIAEREKRLLRLPAVHRGGAIGAFASIDMFFFYAFHELALIPTFLLIGIWGSGNRYACRVEDHDLLSRPELHPPARLILLYRSVPEAARTVRPARPASRRFRRPNPSRRAAKHLPALADRLRNPDLALPVPHLGSGSVRFRARSSGDVARRRAEEVRPLRLLRIAVPMLPEGARHWAWLLIILLLGNIIYVGLVTIAQKRLDWILGYSSVMHMGYIFLGIASGNALGINGAAILMFATASRSPCSSRSPARCASDRQPRARRSRRLAKVMPLGALAFGIGAFASIGLPGFANFSAEVMVFFGAFRNGADMNGFHLFQVATLLALWGVVISAVYMLRAYRATFMGTMQERWSAVADIPASLKVPVAILVIALLWIGFFPQTFVRVLRPAFQTYFTAAP
jgi:NADH-quinone oxidoreductase subunit M